MTIIERKLFILFLFSFGRLDRSSPHVRRQSSRKARKFARSVAELLGMMDLMSSGTPDKTRRRTVADALQTGTKEIVNRVAKITVGVTVACRGISFGNKKTKRRRLLDKRASQ